MQFVYLHIVVFTIWMLFIESKPWPTLTLIVSLEAIFLSTFVMIGQNRQAAFQQPKADHDFTEQELELKTNTQLTREIDRLTIELHNRLVVSPPGAEASRNLPGSGPWRSRRPGARAQLGGEAAACASAQARASAASSTATSAWSTAQAA